MPAVERRGSGVTPLRGWRGRRSPRRGDQSLPVATARTMSVVEMMPTTWSP
jgi:hypothetical protein